MPISLSEDKMPSTQDKNYFFLELEWFFGFPYQLQVEFAIAILSVSAAVWSLEGVTLQQWWYEFTVK